VTIYFIRAGKDGPIKIGHTTRTPEIRLGQLQTGNPHKLHVLEEIHGDGATESKLHARFAEFRLDGEWFQPHEVLLSFIAGISAAKANIPARAKPVALPLLAGLQHAELEAVAGFVHASAAWARYEAFCAALDEMDDDAAYQEGMALDILLGGLAEVALDGECRPGTREYGILFFAQKHALGHAAAHCFGAAGAADCARRSRSVALSETASL
jgi:hypothetical protein